VPLPNLAVASPPDNDVIIRLPSLSTSVTRTAPYEHSGYEATFDPNLSGNLGYESVTVFSIV